MILDLRHLAPGRAPNFCLACPRSWGRRDADLESPDFAAPARRLWEALLTVAAREPRTRMVRLDGDAGQAEFEQRTRWPGFRDRISAEIVDLDGRSSVALYSRSLRGYYDFGANRRRVRRWLTALRSELVEREAIGS